MSHHLERLARRVQNDPFFLASALAAYARSEGLDDPALAAKLGCTAVELTALRLCRMPRAEAPFFWQDVEQIARRFSVAAEVLAEVARRGQSLFHLREDARGQDQEPGFLLAARDDAREPEPPEGADS
jgi:hypothetical protein